MMPALRPGVRGRARRPGLSRIHHLLLSEASWPIGPGNWSP